MRLLSWSLIPIWLHFKSVFSHSLLFQSLMGWFHVLHEWFYMLFVILWAPVRLERFNEVMSSNRWDWNAQREGLLNKKGPRPRSSVCLDKRSSHHSSQGCLQVGSWGGGTVRRYRGRWWGRRRQNHTIIHPLQSLKPLCVMSVFGRCYMSRVSMLLPGVDTSVSPGWLLWRDIV